MIFDDFWWFYLNFIDLLELPWIYDELPWFMSIPWILLEFDWFTMISLRLNNDVKTSNWSQNQWIEEHYRGIQQVRSITSSIISSIIQFQFNTKLIHEFIINFNVKSNEIDVYLQPKSLKNWRYSIAVGLI